MHSSCLAWLWSVARVLYNNVVNKASLAVNIVNYVVALAKVQFVHTSPTKADRPLAELRKATTSIKKIVTLRLGFPNSRNPATRRAFIRRHLLRIYPRNIVDPRTSYRHRDEAPKLPLKPQFAPRYAAPAIMSLTNCRFYEEKFPEIDSFVMVNVKQVCSCW